MARAGRALQALRLHHWIKNVLVFVPLVAAHRIGDATRWGEAMLAFLAWSLGASAVYLLNDLADRHEDAVHPTKRRRPLAAGRWTVTQAVVWIIALLGAAFALAWLLPTPFRALLGSYMVLAAAYSFLFKRVPLVDVLLLAGFYTLRILAGGAAVSVPLSFWLLAFSMFLFLSLALAKRVAELHALRARGARQAAGRGYHAQDLDVLSQFGTASAFAAVLVLALYVDSEAIRALYTHPDLIWLLCPLVLYFTMRIWLLARRGRLDEDPVVFALRDHRSQWAGVLAAVILWAAS